MMNKDCCRKIINQYNSFANELLGPTKKLIHDLKNYDCYNDYEFITEYKECKFLALKHNNNTIFILNNCYEEIGKIVINKKTGNIIALIYHCEDCKIFVATHDDIFSITTNGEFIKYELSNYSKNKIKTSKCTCNKKQFLQVNGCCVKTNNFLVCINTIGIVEGNLVVAYTQEGSTWIAKLTSNGNLVSKIYIDDNVLIKKITDKKCSIELIGLIDCEYHYKYIFDKTKALCSKNYNYCEIVLDSECRVDIECMDIPCDKENSFCEVINSIALIEKCIAKLICYESEKIKKVIDSNCCNKEIITVNNSVCKTIEKITYLEQILKEKLELVIECEKK